MGHDPEVRSNLRMEYHEASHMMNVHQPSLRRMAGDLREFVRETE
jgi:carboxypeptidase C (cathepsin A)